MVVVVSCAPSVPMGMLRWASLRDADRFDPAMIPVTEGKNRASRDWKVHPNEPLGSGVPALSVLT